MIQLPDLHLGVLTAEGVRELAGDLAACSERLQIVPRSRARSFVATETLSLADAIESLLEGQLSGLQLRYVHEGQEWWDTLIARGRDSFQLVRVAHD
ncbi:MAG: hypothetical protein JKY65_27435 [Planctomycetes bacterium]|nr:hypothetical protein [Planctomycetota bacterium]